MSRCDGARSPARWDRVLGPLLERPAAARGIVQRDTDDVFRGSAFALYDVLYKAAFVAAAALACPRSAGPLALVLLDNGYSPAAFAVPGLVSLATAATYRSRSRGEFSPRLALKAPHLVPRDCPRRERSLLAGTSESRIRLLVLVRALNET